MQCLGISIEDNKISKLQSWTNVRTRRLIFTICTSCSKDFCLKIGELKIMTKNSLDVPTLQTLSINHGNLHAWQVDCL